MKEWSNLSKEEKQYILEILQDPYITNEYKRKLFYTLESESGNK